MLDILTASLLQLQLLQFYYNFFIILLYCSGRFWEWGGKWRFYRWLLSCSVSSCSLALSEYQLSLYRQDQFLALPFYFLRPFICKKENFEKYGIQNDIGPKSFSFRLFNSPWCFFFSLLSMAFYSFQWSFFYHLHFV